MNPFIQLKTTPPLLITLALLCFGFLPKAQAVSPSPDGCYPGFTTAEGCLALQNLTTGAANTGLGWRSLSLDSTGGFNTGVGAGTLVLNTADANTATGAEALLNNSTGSTNTANGALALRSNTTGSNNTAVGFGALENATGAGVVFNTAVGVEALQSTTANANTAVGDFALQNVSGGEGNTAIGAVAGANQTTGGGNVYIGNGVRGIAGENDITYIKNIYELIQPVVGTNPDFVTVNSDGRLGRANVSSRRYKHDIKPMDKASEALFQLKPVSFRYNKELDATQTISFGLIAEQVAEVYPDLVGRNPEGQPESVRYEQVNAMLLNEFLKEHCKVQEQGQELQEQAATIAKQQKQIDVLTTGLQKVSTQLELSKSAPQTVLNDQ